MTFVKIFNNQNRALDKIVEFDSGNETLADIVRKYDESCNKFEYRLAVGDEIFVDWQTTIDTCLLYGDSIQIARYPFITNSNEINFKVKTLTSLTIDMQAKPFYSIEKIKALIQDKEGIPPNQQRLIFKGQQMMDDQTLSEFNIVNNSIVNLVLVLRGGGPCFNFADLTKSGERLSSSPNAPEWRIVSSGLCLEGKCLNRNCQAYNNLVIMNIGLPVCYRLNMPGQKATNCPMCRRHVEPITCGFYKCSFRFIGTIKTELGPKRVKSEWKTEKDGYFRFNESNQCKWTSLALETKSSNHSSLTLPVECGICLYDRNAPIKMLPCKHKFHKDCLNQWSYENPKTCPVCRIEA